MQDRDSVLGLPLCLEDLQLLWTGPVGPAAAGNVVRYKQFLVLDEHDGLEDYLVMLFFLRKSLQHIISCRGAADSKPGTAAEHLDSLVKACLHSGSLIKPLVSPTVMNSSKPPRNVGDSRSLAGCLLYSPYAHALLSFSVLELVQHYSSADLLLNILLKFDEYSCTWVSRSHCGAAWTDLIDPISELFVVESPLPWESAVSWFLVIFIRLCSHVLCYSL